jgi:predicted lipid-binding transport protein (Tim44 family)
MKQLLQAWLLSAATVLCALLLDHESVWARPGGGQSYSSDRHGGSGGGGGDFSGELIYLLIRLIFFYPQVGVPVALIVAFVIWRKRNRGFESWDSSAAHQPITARARPKLRLDALFAIDPDFSPIVFEDFAYRLYASTQRARTDRAALEALAPYVAINVRTALAQEEPIGVPTTQVVVGAMRIVHVEVPGPGEAQKQVTVSLVYESNLSVGEPTSRTFFMRESWTLARDKDARTRPPEQTERLGCPSCGAPFESSDSARCRYCNEVVNTGRFAWLVTERRVLSRELRPPALTSEVQEVGTNAPSLVSADQQQAWQELVTRDPALTEADLLARISLIFDKLNHAYSALDLAPVRGLLSDGMFDYLRYWTDAYREQGLRNVLETAHIARVQRVKVQSDRYFDAITFRVWASGLDYTIDVRTNHLVSGSRQRPREYSEYWTLIRAAGVRGQVRADANCPSCAAPLSVTMAGNCSHCGAHITRGEFDWVLSKIEQDEAYEG